MDSHDDSPDERLAGEGGAPAVAGATEVASLTIDDLARRVDMTVRNLREWRTLGLLPEPHKRGRVGYYDESVVRRIEEIKRLHAQGFTLDLIRRMLEAGGRAGGEVMSFARALRAPFRDEAPPRVDVAELGARWGAAEPEHVERAIELGLIRERAGGGLEFASARVAGIGESLRALGLSIDEILERTAAIRGHADGIAEIFEQVWLEHVWEPFVEAGMPEDELPHLKQTFLEVQPLALDSVVALFTLAMEARVESSIAREASRALGGLE